MHKGFEAAAAFLAAQHAVRAEGAEPLPFRGTAQVLKKLRSVGARHAVPLSVTTILGMPPRAACSVSTLAAVASASSPKGLDWLGLCLAFQKTGPDFDRVSCVFVPREPTAL